MRLSYFVHDLSDAAVLRRVKMLRHAGAEVLVLGFRRTAEAPAEIGGAPVVDLGQTFDGDFRQRALMVAAQVLKTPAMKALLARSDVVVARNLEMLVVAASARALHAPGSRLVYECLDVHRFMTSPRPAGMVLRGLERRLLEQSQLMIVSSPGHLRAYFEPFQKLGQQLHVPVAMVENKVLELEAGESRRPPPRPAGPPWRIGWFGMLRCRRSFELLQELAARHPGLIEVTISGRPSDKEFPDFAAEAARAPGVTFTGPYHPDELGAMYRSVHFNWAIDYFEAGANSEWLLPNRIYEGGRYGAVPISLRGSESGRWLADRGLGLLVSDPIAELDGFFQALDEQTYRLFERPSLEAPEDWFIAGPPDCRELLGALAGAPAALESPAPVEAPVALETAAPQSRAVAVIPCLNERSHIGPLIDGLLADPDWRDPLIVVADGGSTDGTREIVEEIAGRDARVRLLHNPARIQSAAVNLAAQAFGEDRRWMVRIDAHAEYPPGFVSSLIREGEKTGAASVVVAMQTRGRGLFQRAAAAAQNSRLGTGGSAHRVGGPAGYVDHGHHALFDLAEFEATQGYDESFSHNEDAEYDVRLRRRGGKIWLTREVDVVYYPRSTPSALFRQYVNYGRGRARTLMKHRERPRPRQMLPLGVAPALLLLTLAPVLPPAALPALSWAFLCLAYGLGLAVRGRSAAAALAGPAAMIMHAGWSFGFWAQLFGAARQDRPSAAGPPRLARPQASLAAGLSEIGVPAAGPPGE